MLNSMGSSNLLESIISIVKTSKSSLVVVQERLKLSGVMSVTVSSPTSGCAPEEGNDTGQKGTALHLLLLRDAALLSAAAAGSTPSCRRGKGLE